MSINIPSESALIAATNWIAGVLTGPAATNFATLAIAAIGFAMLSGRIEWRSGVRVVLGCFILFGAPVIVAELRGAASGGGAEVAAGAVPAGLTLPNQVQPRDPYAGASLPMDEGVRD